MHKSLLDRFAMLARPLLALILATTPAAAQTMIDATEPDAILNVLRGYGSGTLEADADGDPMIRGRIEGTSYTLQFYGCESGKACRSVQFTAAWVNPGNVTLDSVNDWNRTRRFGKAYLDTENDPVLEMNVNLDFGVSQRNFDDTADYWRLALELFRTDVLKN